MKTGKRNFKAIFGPISKFYLIFDLVGVFSSKGDNKSDSMKQVLRVGINKGKIMILFIMYCLAPCTVLVGFGTRAGNSE